MAGKSSSPHPFLHKLLVSYMIFFMQSLFLHDFFFSPNLTINFFLHEKFNQSFFPHPLIHTQHLSYMMLFIQRLFPHRGYIHKHNIHAEFFSTLLTSYMIIFMKRLFLRDFFFKIWTLIFSWMKTLIRVSFYIF